jgi:hypothetical protein
MEVCQKDIDSRRGGRELSAKPPDTSAGVEDQNGAVLCTYVHG